MWILNLRKQLYQVILWELTLDFSGPQPPVTLTYQDLNLDKKPISPGI